MTTLATSPYRFFVKFTRVFTRGSLKGGTHNDTLGFVSESSAKEWLASVTAAGEAGKIDYQIAPGATISAGS